MVCQVITHVLVGAASLCLAVGCSQEKEESRDEKPRQAVRSDKDTGEPRPERVRQLFAVHDVDDTVRLWNDSPVFVICSDGKVIFVDPSQAYRKPREAWRYLEAQLSLAELEKAVHAIGLDELRKSPENIRLADRWGPMLELECWTGKANRTVGCNGVSYDEVCMVFNVDPDVDRQEVTDFYLSRVRDILLETPGQYIELLRFVGTFRPESARPWKPSWLEVLVSRSQDSDPKGKWPASLPPLALSGPARQWHNRQVEGGMRLPGAHLPGLQAFSRPDAFTALGNGQSVAWRYVFPAEEHLNKGATHRQGPQ